MSELTERVKANDRMVAAHHRVISMLTALGDEIAVPDVNINRRGHIAVTVAQPHGNQDERKRAVDRIADALGVPHPPQETNTAYMASGAGVVVHTSLVQRCPACKQVVR